MPQWIHDRAQHIMAKNPDMPESQAWAIATQQSHATGHSPKGYGTTEGRRVAKKKFDTPKDDAQTADPHGIGRKLEKKSSILPRFLGLGVIEGFTDELYKIATQLLPSSTGTMPLKATQPAPLTNNKISKVSQPQTAPALSPSQGTQPLMEAPKVRT